MKRRLDDRGDTNIEMAVLFPIVLIIIAGTVQVGLWFYARNLAVAAASNGARAMAAQSGTTTDGRQAAQSILEGAGGLITGTTITVTRTGTTATVTVTGSSLSLIPLFGGVPISQVASQPVERLTP